MKKKYLLKFRIFIFKESLQQIFFVSNINVKILKNEIQKMNKKKIFLRYTSN